MASYNNVGVDKSVAIVDQSVNNKKTQENNVRLNNIVYANKW